MAFPKTFCGFHRSKPVPPGCFKIWIGFITGTPEGSTESGFMEKPGIEPATPGLQGIALIHYTTAASCGFSKKSCGFSMGRNQYWAGRVYDLCVYYMTGTPEGSTESGFMEKPGNRTCDPWFTRHSAYPLHHGGFSVAFPWVVTSTGKR